ncbi:MAG: hypothetical protein JSV88_33690 [Candidatus Aminicenantes bacterium]|nr:MAG: hypothetical protein JSV88_33690 [Candidatus Aminicenantes bacterium]
MAKNTVVSHLSLDLPKTRIMATIGNANYKTNILKKMLEAGATIFRFNAARIEKGKFEFKEESGDTKHIDIKPILTDINHLSEELRQPITTSLDLAGPKVRMKKFISYHNRREAPQKEKGDKQLKSAKDERQWNQPEIGDIVYLYSKEIDWDAEHIKETLDSIEPASTQKPVRIDKKWRLQTTIESFKTVKEYVSVKDGKCNLQIKSSGPQNDFVKTEVKEVANDFFFSEDQGVNPKGYIFPDILKKKDFKDFDWALENDFDLICVSFVCSPLEYFELKKRIVDLKKNREKDDWQPPLIFAKIETIFAVDKDEAKNYCQSKGLKNQNVYKERVSKEDHERYLRLIELYEENPIKAICETFDGIMVARGDLAVEADKYRVPFYQKNIIEASRLTNKSVIIATEVLLSMDKGNPSTRAEIGDIATAVLDGADVIMLAGEVASTDYDPVLVVEELKKAIETAEEAEEKEQWLKKAGDIQYFYEKFSPRLHEGESHLKEMEKLKLMSSEDVESVRWKIGMGSRICLAARAKNASTIFVSVTTGATARYVSYFRPVQHIISIGSSLEVARRLLLWKGIYPVVMQYPSKHKLNDFILITREIHSVINIKPIGDWKDKKEFFIPGLLRVESKLQDRKEKKLLPNTVHEIPLPNPSEVTPEREIKYILTEPYYKKLRKYLEEKVKQYKEREVKQYLEEKVKQYLEEKVKQDLEEEIKQDLEEKVKQDLEEKIKHYLEEEKVKQDLEKKFKGDIEKEIKQKSKLIKQENYYFYDNTGVIENKKAMVRIRIERVDQEAERAILTIKKEGKKVKDGTVERWEKEFNVTRDLESKHPKDSFEYLPDFFKELIWNEFQDDFKRENIESPKDIGFENVAKMVNTRLTVETASELTLELDAFTTKGTKGDCNYYELEIETIAADEDRRDEYIELLFRSLEIPIVCHKDYPSKFVMTMLDLNPKKITKKFRNAIEYVCKELNISPRKGCTGACT